MASQSLSQLLEAWRAAERRWERHAPASDVRAAALAVIDAWAEYQNAALRPNSDEFMLVADDEGTYVAAAGGLDRVLGYATSELVGLTIGDLAGPDFVDQTPEAWDRFVVDGRQDGTFQLRTSDGDVVWLRYQARAHHPIPGYHVSRLWPADPGP